MLSRDQILAFRPLSRDVQVAEWGGDVRVQEMTVLTRAQLLDVVRDNLEAIEAYAADQALPDDERSDVVKVDKLDQALVTIIHSIVDENGALMFSMADYAAFQGLSFATTIKLWEAIADLGKAPSADAVETEKKSSATTRTSGSRSDSRSR